MRVKKRIIAVGMILILVTLLQNSTVDAKALQSNGGTPAVKNANEWMLEIRKMQEAGGTFGLADVINYDEQDANNSNLKSGNKNLDIHMEKNTEYGAMAILAISGYGNPNVIQNGDTTTGNESGAIMNINSERVAAGTEQTEASIIRNAAKTYKDIYPFDTYVEKFGDAIFGINTWKEIGTINYGFSTGWGQYTNTSILIRAVDTSIFSYTAQQNDVYGSRYGEWGRTYAGRAAVVVGSGI